MMIRKVKGEDYPRLAEIWESAVTRTHDFLARKDFLFYKERLPVYFQYVELYGFEREGVLQGFLGVKEENVEMLFVHADCRGAGIGKRLIRYAIEELRADRVDVNEQNGQAVGFYEHEGFVVVGRSALDGEGKAYPVLHMRWLPGARRGAPGVRVRQEREGDAAAVFRLLEAAFEGMEESDHREQFLVERLHGSGGFVPSLSLVAETGEGEVVGYILMTEVEIVSGERAMTSLALAPLAVLPGFQGRGIGGLLLREAHGRAAALGYGTAVLLGHAGYYPRFGYRVAGDYGIEFPFDVPGECCMVAELLPGALNGVHGRVRYPGVFFE